MTAPARDESDQSATGGRKAQAARNDRRILEAAREVFVADPSAPIAAVAKAADVGISALYRRYSSKEELLRALCAQGLRRYIDAAEAAVADDGDRWETFARFMQRAVDADSSSLTRRLAGKFEPTEALFEAAAHAGRLNEVLFERTRAAGAIRADADVNDLAMILEQLASLRLGGRVRTHELRDRYLALALDGLRAPGRRPLPGPPPASEELAVRWRPR